MNKKVNYLQIIFTIFILAGFVYFFYQNKEEVLALQIVQPLLIIPLILLIGIFFAVNGYVMKLLLLNFNVNLKFKEWFGLSVINTLVNYITPLRGGMLSNAIYLKKAHKFSYSDFLVQLSATYVIGFWINSLVGLISVGLISYMDGTFHLPIFLVFLGAFLSLTLVILLKPQIKETKSPFINRFITVINSWSKISGDKNLILKIGLLIVLNLFLIVGINWLEFAILGFNIEIYKLVLLSIFSSFSLLLSITPGSLGIKEIFSVYSGSLVAIPSVVVVTVSLLDRVVTFLLSLLLGGIFSSLLFKKDDDGRK